MNDKELVKDVKCMTIGLFAFDLIFFIITLIICNYKNLVLAEKIKYLSGIGIGFVLAFLLLSHMAWTLNRAVDFHPDDAQKYAGRQSFLRIVVFILVIVLLAKFVSPHTAVMAAVSLFGIKIGVYSTPFLKSKLYKQR